MPASDKAYECLKELREFAEKHESYRCELVVRDLVKYLEPRQIMEIAFHELEKFLPKFEKYHPNLIWFGEWYEQAKLFKPLDYESNNFEFWGESEDYDYNKSARGWIAFALQDAVRHLDWAYEVYMAGEVTVVFWGYMGSFFPILFAAYGGIHSTENCPQTYLETINIAERYNFDDWKSITTEEKAEIERVNEAWRKCIEAMPYDYWFQLADEFEKYLRNQPA